MTGVTPVAGAVSPREGGPGSILPHLEIVGSTLGCVIAPSLPCAAARVAGIALRLGGPEGDEDSFEIAAVGADGTMLMRLGRYSEEEVVAEWRRLGAASGLPLMIERTDGTVATPYPQVGRVLVGAVRIRRRHGLLNGRRPRFLTRRKTGRLPLRPAVHREREIIGRGS